MSTQRVRLSLRQRRIFSEDLKRKIVGDIESAKVSVLGVSREYGVSETNVYRWLKKYSAHLQPSTTLVVQMESEQYKTKELEQRVRELEAALGRKQMELDYLNQLVELASEDLGVDLKKSTAGNASTGLGQTKTKKRGKAPLP